MRDGFGDVLAQLPQILQLLLALAHHAIQHPTLLHAVFKSRQRGFGHFFGGGLKFQQGIERAVGFERRRYIATAHDFGQGFVGEKFEGGEVELVLEGVQHRHDRVEIGSTEHHGGEVSRRPVQAHGGFDNKAQGAFGADKQLTQVVAGGVFNQVFIQFQQLTFAGDHFQPGDPIAGHAVANHFNATGVGADVAADLAGASGSEVHRVIKAFFFGKQLQLLGDHARLAHGRAVKFVKAQYLIHVVEGDHYFAIGCHCSSR